MQPKARQSSRAGTAKTRTETCELVEEKQKLLDIRAELEREERTRERCIFKRTIDKYSACVEVGKPIDENSACVEAGTTISRYNLRRGEISGINVFIGYIVRASNKGARKKKVGSF
ncbi:hypothetical protein TNCV_4598231 [Trichonephila clavipes]|nr:hypothetical protein TNCV_4598231 [Trichonephila clavipes]